MHLDYQEEIVRCSRDEIELGFRSQYAAKFTDLG